MYVMSLLNKSSLFNFCFKRFSTSLFSAKELRLHAEKGCLSNTLGIKPVILNYFDKHRMLFVPDRKLMNSYFAQSVKKKIEDTYDSLRFFGRGEERLLGFKWYSKLDEIDYKEFFSLLQLPDTFYSWFKVQELHTWMLLLMLPQKSRAHKTTRIGVVQAMWIDTQKRSEILAPDNRNFKKNMRSLYERFQVTLFLYDDAYFSSDTELFSALWFNFFEKENIDPRLIETLVSYIRYQVNYLNDLKITFEAVEDKDLKLWMPLKSHYKTVFQMM